MGMTTDGGPCCCQCWRWYMTEGLAKFLITEHDMPADDQRLRPPPEAPDST